MTDDGRSDTELVVLVARSAVANAAPDELPLFETAAEAYLAAPRRAGRARARDEQLGFGVETVEVLVSTAALAAAGEVLRHVAEGYSDKLLDRLKRMFRRNSATSVEALPELDREQLAKLHELAYQKALAMRVPDEQAKLIADGVIAALAMSRESED